MVTFSLGANSKRAAPGSTDQTLLQNVPHKGRSGQVGWEVGRGTCQRQSRVQGRGACPGRIVGLGVPSMGKVMFPLKETSGNCRGGEGLVGGWEAELGHFRLRPPWNSPSPLPVLQMGHSGPSGRQFWGGAVEGNVLVSGRTHVNPSTRTLSLLL